MTEPSTDLSQIQRDDKLLDFMSAYFRAYRDLHEAFMCLLRTHTGVIPSRQFEFAEDVPHNHRMMYAMVDRDAWSQLLAKFSTMPTPYLFGEDAQPIEPGSPYRPGGEPEPFRP